MLNAEFSNRFFIKGFSKCAFSAPTWPWGVLRATVTEQCWRCDTHITLSKCWWSITTEINDVLSCNNPSATNGWIISLKVHHNTFILKLIVWKEKSKLIQNGFMGLTVRFLKSPMVRKTGNILYFGNSRCRKAFIIKTQTMLPSPGQTVSSSNHKINAYSQE